MLNLMRFRLGSVLVAALAALVGCQGGPAASNGKLKAVSTTGMIHDIVRNVGGGHVESQALMGPGIDPHLYRATAGDVRKLESADIVFYNGLELEGRMEEIFAKLASVKPTHAVAENVPEERLRRPPEFQGRFDPHVWFEVELWRHAASTVIEALVAADPDHAGDYKANGDAYLKKLEALEAWLRAELEKVPPGQRVLITAHDAFGYFGRAYGYEVLGIQGMSTASEASAADIRRLADLIAKKKLKAIFVESSVPQGTIESLRQAVAARGWQVRIGGQLFSDAMGKEGTPEGTYEGMVRHNVRTIVAALQ